MEASMYRSTFAAVAVLAVVLSACSDAPVAPPVKPPATTAELVPALLGTLAVCKTAVRTPTGVYLAKQIKIQVPVAPEGQSPKRARLGYRGWASDVSERVRMAVCDIPDTPAAREAFARAFG